MNAAPNPVTKFIHMIFGTAEPSIAQRNQTPIQRIAEPNISAKRGTRPLKRNEIVPEALRRALAEFVENEVQGYVNYCPNERFRLDQIVAIQTTENRQLLSEPAALKRKMRNDIALACVKGAEGASKVIDTTKFADFNIEAAADASADDTCVYTQVAGSGPTQCHIGFIFYGDYITVDEHAQPNAGGTSNDHTETLNIGAQTTPYLLELRISEAGLPSRSVIVQNLPVKIGRGSTCGVQLKSGYVSRVHAEISEHQGALSITNHSAKGLHYRSQQGSIPVDLSQGQPLFLARQGSFTLTPGVGDLAVRIDYAYTVLASAEDEPDNQPTLETDGSNALPVVAPNPHATPNRGYLGGHQTEPSPAVERANKPLGSAPPTLDSAAFETEIEPNPTGAKARLWIRHSDGQIEQTLVHHFPFVIGRDPEGEDAMIVRDDTQRVSREHVRLVELQGQRIVAENNSKHGTWMRGESLGDRFTWKMDHPGGEKVWYGLGQRPDAAGAVLVRLERMS